MIDLYAPPAPGSLMRCRRVHRPGMFRLSRTDCELYSVQIVGAGTFTRARVLDGALRVLWEQISTFTGSFWLGAGSAGGLIVEIQSMSEADCPNLTVNWRERPERRVS